MHRTHYMDQPEPLFWTPIRIAFAVVYAASFITLYFIL